MKLSNSSLAIIRAHDLGYRVLENGDLTNSAGIVLPGSLNKSGYYTHAVRIIVDGKKKHASFTRHRLQAYQKYGEAMFVAGLVCRHLNNISTDNSIENIVIGTPSQNSRDMPAEKRLEKSINAASRLRKFDDETVGKIRQDHEAGLSYNKLRAKYGVCKGTLSYMFNEARYNGLVPKPQVRSN